MLLLTLSSGVEVDSSGGSSSGRTLLPQWLQQTFSLCQGADGDFVLQCHYVVLVCQH